MLPKLNAPKYQLEIPSTKKKIDYRPFLVKEQKLLLMALESKDPVEMQKAMERIIEDCTFGKVNLDDLAPFDIEYIFLRIRAKSVGEVSALAFKCLNEVDKPKYRRDEDTGEMVQIGIERGECNANIKVDINLEDVTVDTSGMKSNKIVVGETEKGEVGIILRYPSATALKGIKEDIGAAKLLDEMLSYCIKEVYEGDNVFTQNDFSKEEMLTFIDSISTEKMEEIGKFFASIPKISKEIDLVCPSCANKTKYTIEGIEGFFA